MARYRLPNGQIIKASEQFMADHHTGYVEVADGYPVPSRTMSRLSFVRLFTADERKAMKRREKTNEDVEMFLDDLTLAQEIDLGDSGLEQALTLLVALGDLTAERKAEILG